MFNQSAAFNQIKFNNITVRDFLASMIAAGVGGFNVTIARETTIKGDFPGTGGISFPAGRITFFDMLASGVGNIIIPAGKLRTAKATWQGIGEIQIDNESFTIEIMEYTGVMAPGDRIIINTEKFTVTKNNQNDLENFDGNFVNLKEGINEVVFEDGEVSRTVLIRIEHKDRFV